MSIRDGDGGRRRRKQGADCAGYKNNISTLGASISIYLLTTDITTGIIYLSPEATFCGGGESSFIGVTTRQSEPRTRRCGQGCSADRNTGKCGVNGANKPI